MAGNIDEETQENLSDSEEVEATIIERFCIYCHGIVNKKTGLRICLCGYAHHKCISKKVLKVEKQNPLAFQLCKKMRCPNCRKYIKIRPNYGSTEVRMMKISYCYQIFCDVAFAGLIAICIAHVWLTHSILILAQFYEVNELSEIIGPLEPVETTTLCLLTQSSLMIINHGLCWENTLLQCLRRCSRLPVIGCLFPKEYPEVQEYPELLDISKKKVFSTVVGGLLLPYYAQVVGELFLYNVESRLHRYLLGGAAFIAARGAIYMYYKQALYKSKGDIRIVNYEDP